VSPFVGLVFDPARVGPLENVTAPPYDMITADEERGFHAASPHNVVRLILGREGVRGSRNQYTGAATYLRRWREDGALVATERPAWFVYEMTFGFQGRRRSVRGIIGAVDIEPWGGSIVPHEETLAAPIKDRLRLLRKVRANLSPVYGVVTGPLPELGGLLHEVSTGASTRELSDEQGVRHRMWVVADVPDVTRWLEAETLLIADGHHRYATALVYRDEMRARHGPGPWDRMMMLIVDAGTEDPPVLPIHRVIRRGAMLPSADGRRVRDLAEVLASVDDEQLIYGTAVREDGEVVHRISSLRGSAPTVSALHDQVIGDATAELGFTPDAVAAEEAVRAGRAPAAYFLPPTRVAQILSVIERGRRLPQKSTYFWPKPRTGMVIRALE
jgi:uncharacterized protein (DUF1015 family)